MMHEEFERISGCAISYKQYDEIIEPMYMALNMDKYIFCEMIKPTAKKMEREARLEKEEAAAKKLDKIRVVTAENAYGYTYFEAEAIRYNKEKHTVIAKPIEWTYGTYERGNTPHGCWWTSWGYKSKAKDNKDGTFTLKLERVAM